MKSRLATILVTAIVTAVVTSLFWGLGIAVAIHFFTGTPPPFVVRIDAPAEVSVDEMVEVRVEVSNPTEETLELGSLDVYDSLLGGFTVEGVEPEPKERSHTLDFSTFYLRKTLPPGKSTVTRFRLKATKPGVWTGDIDCCTPMEKFVSSSLTIAVKEGKGADETRGEKGEQQTPSPKRGPPAEL